MNDVVSTLRRPRGEYGYDGDYRVVPAPVVAAIFALICLVIAALAVVSALYGHVVWAVVAACVAALLIVNGFLFIRVTRVGKFEVWARVLAGLGLRGDERVLDIGCGRGAGDMTRLPYDDGAFDLIVSSLAIHNLPGMDLRLAAVEEAARVVKSGGRIVIADIAFTRRYAARLRELGLSDVRRRSLGWRSWWGPGIATYLVTATKR